MAEVCLYMYTVHRSMSKSIFVWVLIGQTWRRAHTETLVTCVVVLDSPALYLGLSINTEP